MGPIHSNPEPCISISAHCKTAIRHDHGQIVLRAHQVSSTRTINMRCSLSLSLSPPSLPLSLSLSLPLFAFQYVSAYIVLARDWLALIEQRVAVDIAQWRHAADADVHQRRAFASRRLLIAFATRRFTIAAASILSRDISSFCQRRFRHTKGILGVGSVSIVITRSTAAKTLTRSCAGSSSTSVRQFSNIMS